MKKQIGFVLFVLIAFIRIGSAQSLGAINGQVTDPSGAVVPGATVTATNAGTGITRKTVAGSAGEFTIPALTPGAYNVSAEAPGFAKSEQNGETLLTGTTLSVNFKLGLASTTQKVEVTTETPLIDVTESAPPGTLQTSEVQNLPILNRNFAGLVTLIPGARPTGTPVNNKISLGGGIGFGGGAGRAGGAEVDGVPFRDEAGGGPLFNVSLEGVQEFSVLVHDYGAQYGVSSNGVVLITTKSGTNQLHGSAFAFGRNQSMTALDYFSNPTNGGLGKPPYDRELYGGSFGAPIIKDKVFFFGAIERNQQDQALLWSANVYQQAQIAKAALAVIPTSSCAYCAAVGNAIVPAPYAPQTLRDLLSSGRADYQINAKHSLFFRWLGENTNSYDDIIQSAGGLPHPDNDPNDSNVYDPLAAQSGVLSETWVVSNRSVNTVAAAANHISESQYCHCTYTGDEDIWMNQSYPDFLIGENAGTTNSVFVQTDVLFTDTFEHQVGKHALKFGGEYVFYPRIGYDREQRGSITFFDDPSTIVGNTNGKYPKGYQTPGAIKSLTTSTVNYGGGYGEGRLFGAKEWAIFFQDDWQVRRGLTLNLGMRYSMDINYWNESLQSQNRATQLLNSIGSVYGGNPQTPTRDYSPRVGFAWDVKNNGRNVIRGSFGRYIDESLSGNMNSVTLEMLPTLQNINATYSNTSVGTGQLASTIFGQTPTPELAPGLPNFPAGGGSTIQVIAPNSTNPSNMQTHFGYTHQFSTSTVASADFTHVLGLHDERNIPVNPLESPNWDPNYASYESCANTGSYRRLTCAFNATGLTQNTVGQVDIIDSNNRSQYNELDLHIEQRSRRVSLQGTYTLSTAYAFGGTIGGTGTGGGVQASEVPFQWFVPSEWGPTLADERHRVVVSAVFNLPWGITASPISQFATARPYNCVAGTDWTGSGSSNARCWANSSGELVATPSSPASAVAGTAPVSLDSLRGQAMYNLDTRVGKVVKIRERFTANLFAEFYNITNRANFGNNYNGTKTSTAFEKPAGYLNQGLSLPTSRQLQLGARFTF